MTPVYNEIVQIEERKRTPEYEGNIKEVEPTHSIDLKDVTAMAKMETVVMNGGVNEKTNSPGGAHYNGSYQLDNLMVTGDKHGSVSLVDVSKSKVIDTKALDCYKGRRIVSITTCSLEWLETRLTYVAVVARASPIISIFCFKSSENKMHHVYSVNMERDESIENVHELEQVENYCYAKLPAEAKLSNDFEFLAVTTYDGSVQLIKMPAVFDPLQLEAAKKAPADGAEENEKKEQQLNNFKSQMYASRDDLPASTHGLSQRADLELVEHLDLDLNDVLIADIPAKKAEQFVDPYHYTEPVEENKEEGDAPVEEA